MTSTLDVVYEYGSDQWELLQEGGGGYITGLAMGDEGTMYCRTDVCGFYCWKNGEPRWKPVYSLSQNFEPGTERMAGGYTAVWEIACSRSNPENAYVVVAGPTNFALQRLYYTTNYGELWTWTGVEYWGPTGQDDWNRKFSQEKVVVDPNNKDVVYVGMCRQSSQTYGAMRAIDGHTFTEVSAIPHSSINPGTCAIAFDRYGGTTTVSGQLRTARLMIGVAGVGAFESTDGGVTFTQVSEDITPSNTNTVTTSVTNCLVIALISYSGSAHIKSVKMDGVDMTYRIDTVNYPGYQKGLYSNLGVYYLNAATTGTKTVVVEFTNGGKGHTSDLKLLALADADPTTPFPTDAYYSPFNGTATPPTVSGFVTASGTNFFFAFSLSADATPTSTWTGLTLNGTSFYSEYIIGTGTQTSTIASGVGIVVDSVRWKGTGTLALNAQSTTATATTGSPNTEPSRFQSGKFAANGDYWMTSGPYNLGVVSDDIWRYRSGVWLKARANWCTQPTTHICVDTYPIGITPGPSVIHIVGNQGWEYGESSFDADEDVPTFSGTTSGSTSTVTSPYVPWQLYAGSSSPGPMEYDPRTGTLWHANGLGMAQFTGLDYRPGTHNIVYEWRSEGIEELVSTFVLEPQNGTEILACVHDRIIMQCRIGRFPLAYYESPYDAHAWDISVSASDPDFLVSAISQYFIPGQTTSSWSDDAGATWQRFDAVPAVSTDPGRNYGASGSAHGGCIASASPTNHVIVMSQGMVLPQYTTDNGETWIDCDIDPGQFHDSNFLAAYNFRSKTIAADYVDIGTFYIYDYLTGFHRSLDGGATWSLQSGPWSNFGAMWAIPGFEGHLVACSFYGNESKYSKNGGASWTAFSGMTGGSLIGVGKPSPGSAYGADIYLFCVRAAVDPVAGHVYQGVAVSDDPDDGFTWTSRGSVFSSTSAMPDGGLDAPQTLTGSWRRYNRCFIGYNSTGHIVFNGKQN